MALTTTPNGVWVLQALLGVETLPVALRLRPFIPSLYDESVIVDTTAGPVPLAHTAEYASLVAAGVIDAAGAVDDTVRDWMTVLSRAERQVVLAIRRPDPATVGGASPTVQERVLVVCRHRRWLAMAARDGDEVVIDAVGESEQPDQQAELICNVMLPAFGDAYPADIEGVNVPAELMYSTLNNAAPHGHDVVVSALARLGLAPPLTEVLTAAARFDESAMAVVSVIDTGVTTQVHPRVLTVADTAYGRVSITTSASADGKEWMTIWPATVSGLRDELATLLAAPQAA
jgi:EspG family